MPRFHLTHLYYTCTQAPDLTRIPNLSLPLLCRAGAIFCSLSVWPLHRSPHAVSLAVSTMANTKYRTHHTYCQHSAITMAPSSTNGTSPYRPVSSATTTDPVSLSGHFAATASSYLATSLANPSSTGTNLHGSHTSLPTTTSDAGP